MKNILLIEPDPTTADVIKKYLENDELKVYAARTSQMAVDIADKNKPDLVIVELAISDQNGVAFLHEFRSYSDWSKVPVIIHTHLAISKETTEKAWKLLGVTQSLYKPSTTLKKLKTTVLTALES